MAWLLHWAQIPRSAFKFIVTRGGGTVFSWERQCSSLQKVSTWNKLYTVSDLRELCVTYCSQLMLYSGNEKQVVRLLAQKTFKNT